MTALATFFVGFVFGALCIVSLMMTVYRLMDRPMCMRCHKTYDSDRYPECPRHGTIDS